MWFFILVGLGLLIYWLLFSKKATEWSNKYQLEQKEAKKNFEAKINDKFSEEGLDITLRYSTVNNSIVGIDEKQKKVCFLANKYINSKGDITKVSYKAETYYYKDILESEVIIDGETVTRTSRSSQVGGALIGAALTGGIGAIIGGLSGKKTSHEKVEKVYLKLIVNNIKKPIILLSFLDEKKSISKKEDKYIKAHKKVMDMHGLFVLLISMADKDDLAKLENNEVSEETVVAPSHRDYDYDSKTNSDFKLHNTSLVDSNIAKEVQTSDKEERELNDNKKTTPINTSSPESNELFATSFNSKPNEYIEDSPSSDLQTTNLNSHFSYADEIKKLHDLFIDGILTEEEFNSQKKRILS